MNSQTPSRGMISAQDDFANPIALQWERIDGKSARLNEKICEVSSILAVTYTRQELDFAKAHPETVSHQYFLTAIAPLFSKGADKVDWNEAEARLTDTFNEMFDASDFEQYVSENESSIFVVARAKGCDTPLGVVQFLVTPEFPEGTVKSAYFAVAPHVQNRGIERLLMSSGFKIIPGIQRIFMHTRTTNEAMIKLYKSWGFKQFEGTLPHWIDLEYLAMNTDHLQKISLGLVTFEVGSTTQSAS